MLTLSGRPRFLAQHAVQISDYLQCTRAHSTHAETKGNWEFRTCDFILPKITVFTVRVQHKDRDLSLEVGIVTVSGGRRPKTSIRALYISSAVPSKNFPQPATNRVSPIHNVNITRKNCLLIQFYKVCTCQTITIVFVVSAHKGGTFFN